MWRSRAVFFDIRGRGLIVGGQGRGGAGECLARQWDGKPFPSPLPGAFGDPLPKSLRPRVIAPLRCNLPDPAIFAASSSGLVLEPLVASAAAD